MILLSLLFVVVSAITLLIGVVFRDDLSFIYASIAAGGLGALFLILSYIRGRRPARRPAAVLSRGSTDAAGAASWSDAKWGGGGEDALQREDTTPVSTPTVTADAPGAPVTPADGLQAVGDAAFQPPAERAPTPQPAAAAEGWAPPPPPKAPSPQARTAAPRVSPPSAPTAPPPPPKAPPPPA